MSIKGVFKAECPSCNERFDADFWTVIRGDRDENLKEAIMSGEFDLLMCPSCSNVFPCEETFIYMDPEKELLVFVMPESYLKEKEKWLEKMRLDYETLKGSCGEEGLFVFEPQYYFGAAPLAELLLRDRDMEEETEVMLFMAGQKGFKHSKISSGFARRHDLPFFLPYAGPAPDRDSALKAARRLAADNDALIRIKNLLKTLEELEGRELPFIRQAEAKTNR
ncbi:MAG: CpXC domain-containing protein [Elusimicrobiales bacterium]|jgi:hypothetical protein